MNTRILCAALLLSATTQLTAACNDPKPGATPAKATAQAAPGDTARQASEKLPEEARALVSDGFADSLQAYKLRMKDITRQTTYGHRTMAPGRKVDIIVIHSSYHAAKDTFNTQGVIGQFRHYDVATHYLISRDGTVYKMVEEKDVAWQAGKSQLPGTQRTNLNTTSIGIEVMSTKHNGPTRAQYEALTALVAGIRQRHPIKYLLRHGDIAPARRDDPWGFNWPAFVKLVEATSGDGLVYFTHKMHNIATFK